MLGYVRARMLFIDLVQVDLFRILQGDLQSCGWCILCTIGGLTEIVNLVTYQMGFSG